MQYPFTKEMRVAPAYLDIKARHSESRGERQLDKSGDKRGLLERHLRGLLIFNLYLLS